MRLLALLPFGYATVTRHNTRRDFAYLVASQWLPGIWLIFRLGDADLPFSVALYAIGYLAFISIYEIGYLANDTWDARRHPDGRRRFPYEVTPLYLVAFVALRLALWGFITIFYPSSFGILNWLALYGALVIVFSMHNIIGLDYIKIATFMQLCIIRFSSPVIYGLQGVDFILIFIICSIFYLHFRYIVYLESKSLLAIPRRKSRHFNLVQLATLSPLVVLLSIVTSERVILEIFIYFMALYGVYALTPSQAKTE